MDNNELNTEKIIQHLDGDLTGDELENFKKLLSENSALQQELDSLSLAKMAVQSYGLKAQVASVREEMMEELKHNKKKPESRIYPFIRATLKYAASVLLLLCLTGTYFYITSSSAKLYKDNYEPYKLSITRGESISRALEKAFDANNYAVVISTFKSLTNPADKDYFLVAQAYQSIHQPTKAIQYYKLVLESSAPGDVFKDDAEYYLALTYLENNDPLSAKPIFEKIYLDKDHLYHDKVTYWTMLKLKLVALKSSKK